MKPITAPSIARADRLADLFAQATVVLFAGAGGTCIGIEQAYIDGAVVIDGKTYVITDIAMRMLTPRELLLAQEFPTDYRVDQTVDGERVSKADQVKLIGNAVPPPFARAIAYANVVTQGVLNETREAVAS